MSVIPAPKKRNQLLPAFNQHLEAYYKKGPVLLLTLPFGSETTTSSHLDYWCSYLYSVLMLARCVCVCHYSGVPG